MIFIVNIIIPFHCSPWNLHVLTKYICTKSSLWEFRLKRCQRGVMPQGQTLSHSPSHVYWVVRLVHFPCMLNLLRWIDAHKHFSMLFKYLPRCIAKHRFEKARRQRQNQHDPRPQWERPKEQCGNFVFSGRIPGYGKTHKPISCLHMGHRIA